MSLYEIKCLYFVRHLEKSKQVSASIRHTFPAVRGTSLPSPAGYVLACSERPTHLPRSTRHFVAFPSGGTSSLATSTRHTFPAVRGTSLPSPAGKVPSGAEADEEKMWAEMSAPNHNDAIGRNIPRCGFVKGLAFTKRVVQIRSQSHQCDKCKQISLRLLLIRQPFGCHLPRWGRQP